MSAFNIENDQRADGWPTDDLASCNWRVFEVLGCFDTSLEVFVRKARIESVNFIVYRA